MYSSGMTNRDIRNHIKKIYNVELSPEQISRITDMKEWQNRPLERSYAIVYLDATGKEQTEVEKLCQEYVCGVKSYF
jgi:transposase-like protein